MSDHTISKAAHEQAGILLQQAAAIAGLLTYNSLHGDDPGQREAAWAVQDMILRASDLIGHV